MSNQSHSTHGAEMVVTLEPPSAEDLAAGWKKLMALGVLTILVGAVAIVLPHVASLAASLLIGAAVLVVGILDGVHAWEMRGRKGQVWRVLGAVLGIGLGGLLLLFPVTGVVSLTLLLAIFFVAEGAFKAVMAFQVRPMDGWGWLLASGLLALALGVLVLVTWPEAALWLLGLLLGIDLVFGGWWLVFLALAGRRMAGHGGAGAS